ncbi:MAG: lipopolysaccharide biosynthesis protein [Eubacterium sp.]|nr:lipopolysaccharide biosynthesis protein [Eubacterium sp.]
MKQLTDAQQRKLGVILSYTHIILQVVVGMLYTPFMVEMIAENEYGLYTTISQTAEMLGLFNMGFSASYIRFYTKFKKNEEYKRIDSFNALFFTAFAILAAAVFITGIIISFNLEAIFDKGLTAQEYRKAQSMMIMLTVSMAVGFLVTVFNCFITAHQRFVFGKGMNILNVLLLLVLNLIVLLSGGKSVSLTAVHIGVAIGLNLLYVFYAFKKLHIRFDFKHIEKDLFKQVFIFSAFIAINMIVDMVNNKIDNLIITRFCGTAVTAVYAIGAKLNGYFTTFSLAVSGVFTPHVHNIVNSYAQDSKEQRNALTNFFVKVGRFQYLFLALILSGYIFFGKAFISLWMGESFQPAYWIALVMMAPSIVPLTQNVGIEIQRAENRHHYRSYIYGTMAIVNLIMTVILVPKYQGLGAAIGTGFACVVANIIIMDIVYHKKININIFAYWKNIGRQTLGMLVPFAIGAVIMHFVTITSWVPLILWIVIYAAIYLLSVWFFSMNRYEKRTALAAVDKLLKTKLAAKYADQ